MRIVNAGEKGASMAVDQKHEALLCFNAQLHSNAPKETAFLCIMVVKEYRKLKNYRFPCIHGPIHLVGLTFTSHVLGLHKPRGSSNEALLYIGAPESVTTLNTSVHLIAET